MSLTQNDLQAIREVVVDGIEAVVSPRLETLESRLDTIETRLDTIETRLDTSEAAIKDLSTETNHLTHRIGRVEVKLDKLDVRVETVENDVKAIYEMLVPTNSALNKTLKNHERRLTSLESQAA